MRVWAQLGIRTRCLHVGLRQGCWGWGKTCTRPRNPLPLLFLARLPIPPLLTEEKALASSGEVGQAQEGPVWLPEGILFLGRESPPHGPPP